MRRSERTALAGAWPREHPPVSRSPLLAVAAQSWPIVEKGTSASARSTPNSQKRSRRPVSSMLTLASIESCIAALRSPSRRLSRNVKPRRSRRCSTNPNASHRERPPATSAASSAPTRRTSKAHSPSRAARCRSRRWSSSAPGGCARERESRSVAWAGSSSSTSTQSAPALAATVRSRVVITYVGPRCKNNWSSSSDQTSSRTINTSRSATSSRKRADASVTSLNVGPSGSSSRF